MHCHRDYTQNLSELGLQETKLILIICFDPHELNSFVSSVTKKRKNLRWFLLLNYFPSFELMSPWCNSVFQNAVYVTCASVVGGSATRGTTSTIQGTSADESSSASFALSSSRRSQASRRTCRSCIVSPIGQKNELLYVIKYTLLFWLSFIV